jgi:hypothetical protein
MLMLLLALIALPPAVAYLLPVGSFAPGTAAACLLVVLAMHRRVSLRRRPFVLGSIEATIVLLAAGIGLHGAIASLLVPVAAGRFFGSLVILGLMLLAARTIGPLFLPRGARAARALFWILLACAVAALAGFAPAGADGDFVKPVFPFSEPSHFALSFLPLLAWRCAVTRGWRRWLYLGAAMAAALALQNLTFVAGIVLIVATIARPWRVVLIGGAAAALAAVAAPDLSYYADRLMLSDESMHNLSALVYLQGWQLVEESLRNTFGWGLSFQQLGVNGTQTEASQLIYAMLGYDSNLLDGSFLAVKLLSEFGIFGFAAIALYLRLAWRSLRALRIIATARRVDDAGGALAHAVVVMYAVELFMRSSGYLVGTGVLFMAAVMYLRRGRQARTRQAASAGSASNTGGVAAIVLSSPTAGT